MVFLEDEFVSVQGSRTPLFARMLVWHRYWIYIEKSYFKVHFRKKPN